MKVALGGSSAIGREWMGLLLAQLDRHISDDVGISYSADTLDIQDDDIDQVLKHNQPQSALSWNTQNATARSDRVQENGDDIVLLGTPDTPNDYLDTLLGPATHMCIFTETRHSSVFDDWMEISEDCDVTVTHHVITNERGSKTYERVADDITIIHALVKSSQFKQHRRKWLYKSEAAEKLTYDLIQNASQNAP